MRSARIRRCPRRHLAPSIARQCGWCRLSVLLSGPVLCVVACCPGFPARFRDGSSGTPPSARCLLTLSLAEQRRPPSERRLTAESHAWTFMLASRFADYLLQLRILLPRLFPYVYSIYITLTKLCQFLLNQLHFVLYHCNKLPLQTLKF